MQRRVIVSLRLAMLSPEARDALLKLAAHPELGDALCARWRQGGREVPGEQPEARLPEDLRSIADQLGGALATLTRSDEGDVAALGEHFAQPGGEVLFLWCDASTWRRDAHLAPLLAIAATQVAFRQRVAAVARAQV